MYTQCPDCKSAFRVVADDLRQAAGKVRCGDCGAAFDALLYLSEEPPEPQGEATSEPVLPELRHESGAKGPQLPESISANESIALLQTLDELAGSDIRIEDTGIEWRVLDDVAMSDMGTDEAQAGDQPAPDDEVRYDDDSPLPDKIETDDDLPADNDADSVVEDAAVGPEPQLMVDGIDANEIDDSGDWEAILDEFDEPAAGDTDDEDVDDEPPQSDDATVQAGNESPVDESIEQRHEATSDEGDDDGDDDASIDESQDEISDDIEIVLEGYDDVADDPDAEAEVELELEAEAEAEAETELELAAEAQTKLELEAEAEAETELELEAEAEIELEAEIEVEIEAEAEADGQATPLPQPGESSGDDGSPSQWQLLDEDEQDESIPTLNEPHDISPGTEAVEEPNADDGLDAEEDIGVESIVMEGESVHVALDDMEAAASLRAAADEADLSATFASAPPRARSAGPRGGLIFVMFLLLAALSLQAVHQRRETLAKIPAVNDIIGPLYRMTGKPLAPAWDVTGWSFEATTGNAENNDERLNIYTRIGNRSDEPLPYPLIGVSLTDRFEEIIGSRVLEPSGYLVSDLNPHKLVAPGESFEAFIAVESPDTMASGYKLDVCYRLPDRRLRCAIGDFR